MYDKEIAYEWDDAKSRKNLAAHGVDFILIKAFDWETALMQPDLRRDYGEKRFVAIGLLGNRLHVVVFTPRGMRRRIISLRKANGREAKTYSENIPLGRRQNPRA